MSQAAKAQEPSMDEILASIRRIIADEEPGPAQPQLPDPPALKPAPAALPATAQPTFPAYPEEEAQSLAAQDSGFVLAGTGPASAVYAQRTPAEPDDVFDLTEAMQARAEPSGRPDMPEMDARSDVVFADLRPQPAAQPRQLPQPVQAAQPPPKTPAQERPLLSDETSAAVTSAFGSLAHTVLVQNARTLDDLVRDMLRPMLKSWLDDNLPNIVERLVRAEIERVSRGRG